MEKCEEPDSNRRTPAGMDPKSIAFDLARRSSHDCSFVILRVLGEVSHLTLNSAPLSMITNYLRNTRVSDL